MAAPSAANLSLLGLFLQADIVVKLVMLVLLFASVWVWAMVFEKVITLRRVNREADGFEDGFWSGGSLDESVRARGHRPRQPDGRRVRRRDERVAAHRAHRRRRDRQDGRARARRPGDERDRSCARWTGWSAG